MQPPPAGPARGVDADGCTVIVPTLARAERAPLLLRAIASIQENRSSPRALVVVNGRQYDHELVTELEARRDVDVLRVEKASLPVAIAAGRNAVRSAFFSFLDDDDEYLARAVDLRLDLMRAESTAAVGVTNGFRQSPARTAPALHRLAGVSADPLLALFHENWLASCGAIYRTADAGPEFFADLPAYLEWTTLAFELATAGKRIVALDTPTFRINETDGSLSRSRAYERHALNALHRMLARSSRSDIRRLIKRRIAQGWHSCSDQALKAGEGREALRCHLMSLRHAPGWRYLPYSRHLLPLLARQPASARQSS